MDLSVVVTTHSEDYLLRPTLTSISQALHEVAAAGFTCELIIVQDNGTIQTIAQAEKWRLTGIHRYSIRTLSVSKGDAGSARNAGVEMARGQLLAVCDGDDLVSKNYFIDGLKKLNTSTVPTIAHPEFVISFGARSLVWPVKTRENHGISYEDLLNSNLWPATSMSQRRTYLDHPFPSLRPQDGYGPEDWLWNIQTSAAGITHTTLDGTLGFYRTREHGGVNNENQFSILPWFDVTALKNQLPKRVSRITGDQDEPSGPLTALSAPQTWWSHGGNMVQRAIFLRGITLYRGCLPAIRLLTNRLPPRHRRNLYLLLRNTVVGFFEKSQEHFPEDAPNSFVSSPDIISLLQQASQIEPALSWTALGIDAWPTWEGENDGYADLLTHLVFAMEGRADAIVAAPWVGIGGADIVAANYAKGLNLMPENMGSVTLLTTQLSTRTLSDALPSGAHHLQMPEAFASMSSERQRRLLAQVVILARPKVLVSVNCFDVTRSLELFGPQITDATRVYLTLFAFDNVGPGTGYPTNPITDNAQRNYLSDISGLITDNSRTAIRVQEILGLDDTLIKVHHQPGLREHQSFTALIRESRAYNDVEFSDDSPFRVMWPHRLDKEKRPDVLMEIASRASDLGLPFEFHVHGQTVMSEQSDDILTDLQNMGLRYHGPYAGGLSTLDVSRYHGILLTSESEGLPLVLVQAMHLGIPVVASNVGGVPDIVEDGVTGLLTDGPEDIQGYIDALIFLMQDRAQARRIIEQAFSRADEQHGWARFQSILESEFHVDSKTVRTVPIQPKHAMAPMSRETRSIR